MSKKNVEQICRKFKRDMQKIVDKDDGVTGISIEIGGEKHIIAEKKKEKPKTDRRMKNDR